MAVMIAELGCKVNRLTYRQAERLYMAVFLLLLGSASGLVSILAYNIYLLNTNGASTVVIGLFVLCGVLVPLLVFSLFMEHKLWERLSEYR